MAGTQAGAEARAMEKCCLLTWSPCFFYTTQEYLLRGGTTQAVLDPFTSIVNQGKVPLSLMKAISQLKVPLPR